jgi:hypothetical protein
MFSPVWWARAEQHGVVVSGAASGPLSAWHRAPPCGGERADLGRRLQIGHGALPAVLLRHVAPHNALVRKVALIPDDDHGEHVRVLHLPGNGGGPARR